jgi:hypothetical protein
VKPHSYKKKSGKKITNETTHTRGEKLESCMCYPDAAGLNGVPVQTLAHTEAHLADFRKPGRLYCKAELITAGSPEILSMRYGEEAQ